MQGLGLGEVYAEQSTGEERELPSVTWEERELPNVTWEERES